jgi:hypothetical protein
MPWFRDPRSYQSDIEESRELSVDEARRVVASAVLPGHFFVGKGNSLEWQPAVVEEVSWEIFRGRLLDSTQTRQRQTLESWNIFWLDAGGRSAEPLLSVKLDASGRQLHVTRAIHCYAWEGYHAGDNVYLSRERQRWLRELVGTIDLASLGNAAALADEIICLLFQAVVGCSRLPLTSLEAPLPSFSLGQLAYVHRPGLNGTRGAQPLQSFRGLIEAGGHDRLAWLEKAKLLEIVLCTITGGEVAEAAALFSTHWQRWGHQPAELMALCRTLFNAVALSPYTDFTANALAFIEALVAQNRITPGQQIDFLSYLLRQNARHLTAYDLVTFHHRGANYPDALLLDAVLKEYLEKIERSPALFMTSASDALPVQKQKRIRRRALRQGWLMRFLLQDLPVPDLPTSPGENMRVLPAPHPRVPEEQILDSSKRSKRLFADQLPPLLGEQGLAGLRLAMADLAHTEELQELGTALFLDRPLGLFKAPGEPDRTPLLSYEAFSPAKAEEHLEALARSVEGIASAADFGRARSALRQPPAVTGVPLSPLPLGPQRPGTVSLDDALKVAKDFVLLQTARQSAREFLDLFDFRPLAERSNLDYLQEGRRTLIVRAMACREPGRGSLLIFDSQARKRLELQVDPARGYHLRAGKEFPAAGLRVERIWEIGGEGEELRRVDLEKDAFSLPPRG